MNTKYVIESWEVFKIADKLYGVDVYKPRHFSDDILKGVVAFFEFLLGEKNAHKKYGDDELVLKKVMLLISNHIDELDIFNKNSILKHKYEIRLILNKYLLSCKVELNRRLNSEDEITLRFIE